MFSILFFKCENLGEISWYNLLLFESADKYILKEKSIPKKLNKMEGN